MICCGIENSIFRTIGIGSHAVIVKFKTTSMFSCRNNSVLLIHSFCFMKISLRSKLEDIILYKREQIFLYTTSFAFSFIIQRCHLFSCLVNTVHNVRLILRWKFDKVLTLNLYIVLKLFFVALLTKNVNITKEPRMIKIIKKNLASRKKRAIKRTVSYSDQTI